MAFCRAAGGLMARIRSLKPETASDRKLAENPLEVRYTFLLILSRADDYGLLLAEPRQLLGELYPHDTEIGEKKLQTWVEILVQRGHLRWRETTDGARVIEVVNWRKHQKIKDPGKPLLRNRLRAVENGSAKNPRSSGEKPPVSNPEISGDLRGADRERERERDKGKGTYVLSDGFEEAWNLYPKRPNNSKAKALKAWLARARDGEPAAAMIAGVRAYAGYVQRAEVQSRFIKLAATFFGPDKPYLDDYGTGAELVHVIGSDGAPTRAFLDATGLKAPAA